ncbi:MAG: hypothetical protein K9G46_13020 [Flavobacteriales bacterium]|jgi:hypothetical protein|nr:hypothetical protein [Flavobacteriales bacterium]
MARIIFPENLVFLRLLFDAVKEKHESFAVGTSPIEAFINQHDISFVDDQAALSSAEANERAHSNKSKEAEDHTQKRDLKWDPVFANVRNYYQFLKKLYSPNYMELGNWGAPITTTGRIKYPTGYDARALIFKALQTKYDTYLPLGSSPLDPFLTQNNTSIAADAAAMAASQLAAKAATKLAKESEDATQDRNNAMATVSGHLRSIGAFLMALYPTNPKELGHWGFTVDDSPRAPKQIVSKVKLSSTKTVGHCIIGGTFKNNGTTTLHLYRGKTASGSFVTILPGDVYGITKGFSVLTVLNTSSTTTGIFSVLRAK